MRTGSRQMVELASMIGRAPKDPSRAIGRAPEILPLAERLALAEQKTIALGRMLHARHAAPANELKRSAALPRSVVRPAASPRPGPDAIRIQQTSPAVLNGREAEHLYVDPALSTMEILGWLAQRLWATWMDPMNADKILPASGNVESLEAYGSLIASPSPCAAIRVNTATGRRARSRYIQAVHSAPGAKARSTAGRT